MEVLDTVEGKLECVYCGAPTTDSDHLMPLVRGRSPRGQEPCALLCPCNQSKGGSDWKAWMLGKAKASPTSRKVPDITQKIERLERYVARGKLQPVPLEELAGSARWEEYWQHLRAIEKALAPAQAKAVEVQAAILETLDQRRAATTS